MPNSMFKHTPRTPRSSSTLPCTQFGPRYTRAQSSPNTAFSSGPFSALLSSDSPSPASTHNPLANGPESALQRTADAFTPSLSISPLQQLQAIAQAGVVDPHTDRDWQSAWQAGHAPFQHMATGPTGHSLNFTPGMPATFTGPVERGYNSDVAWGRGYWHRPTQTLHTWAEDEGTHSQVAEQKWPTPTWYAHNDLHALSISPDGMVNTADYEPGELNEIAPQIEAIDPRLTVKR